MEEVATGRPIAPPLWDTCFDESEGLDSQLVTQLKTEDELHTEESLQGLGRPNKRALEQLVPIRGYDMETHQVIDVPTDVQLAAREKYKSRISPNVFAIRRTVYEPHEDLDYIPKESIEDIKASFRIQFGQPIEQSDADIAHPANSFLTQLFLDPHGDVEDDMDRIMDKMGTYVMKSDEDRAKEADMTLGELADTEPLPLLNPTGLSEREKNL